LTFAIFNKTARTVTLIASLVVSMPAAFAQTTETPAATAEAQKNNWAVNCGAGETASAPLVCQMVQNVVVKDTNQRLLTVVIRPQAGSANHTLTLALPHGVDFLKGVQVAIDDKDATSVPVQTSNQQGAFANLPISDDMLAELKAGTSVKISFQAVSGQSFAVPLSLIGFTAAYEKLSAG